MALWPLFSLYPIVLLTIWLLLGGFVGTLGMKLVANLSAPALVSSIVGAISGLGAFASVLWLTEPQTYLLYLCDDGVSTYQFAHHQRPDGEAQWFRDRLRRLAVAPDIDWVDYQSRHDIMNFWPFDPVAGHDIVLDADERRNPTVVAISFCDLWIPGNFGRRRWRFFQAHFQSCWPMSGGARPMTIT